MTPLVRVLSLCVADAPGLGLGRGPLPCHMPHEAVTCALVSYFTVTIIGNAVFQRGVY